MSRNTSEAHAIHGTGVRGPPVVPPVALADIVRDDDLIVTVCDSAHEELVNPQSLHWSIPDPVVVGTDAAFDHAFTEIAARIADLAPRLTPST